MNGICEISVKFVHQSQGIIKSFMARSIEETLNRLDTSKFRSSFHLSKKDREYIEEKGMDVIERHARDFVKMKLADPYPTNDGKQTPMRGAPKGHPVFIGQHATGTCCRGCLEKWHGIPKGRPMSETEQEHVVDVLMQWIGRQMKG